MIIINVSPGTQHNKIKIFFFLFITYLREKKPVGEPVEKIVKGRLMLDEDKRSFFGFVSFSNSIHMQYHLIEKHAHKVASSVFMLQEV